MIIFASDFHKNNLKYNSDETTAKTSFGQDL